MSGTVQTAFDADGAVARIELDRPESYNALNDDLIEDLEVALRRVERDDAVRVVVVSGAGDAFCAGGDVNRMQERRENDTATADRRREIRFEHNDTVRRLFELDKPTVARVQGPAMGAGADLALACDIVIAAEDATFGWVFRKVGMSVDFAGSYLLPNMVGLRRAKELVLGGQTLSGEEASSEGLITRAVPEADIDDAVAEWIEDLAEAPTEALVLAKQTIHRGATSTFAEAIEKESLVQSVLYNTRDHEEATAAFVEDRDPEFVGE